MKRCCAWMTILGLLVLMVLLPEAALAAPSGIGRVANTDGDNLRLRAAPSLGAPILKRLGPNWSVRVLGPGSADGRWLKVEHAGVTGYVAAAYVVLPGATVEPPTFIATTAIAPTVQRPAAITAPIGKRAPANGRPIARPGSGQPLADEAAAHVGRPYVWGGEDPEVGFDCSGLVRYVVQKVTGLDVTHVLAQQAQTGQVVKAEQLRAGDLVFFQNTYKPGLSHVGVYVGDGIFAHAQNEGVGVVRSTLDLPYWRERWYGGRRLAD